MRSRCCDARSSGRGSTHASTEPRRPRTSSEFLHPTGHKQLVETTRKVLALKETMPDLVILPAHDPTAAQRLLDS